MLWGCVAASGTGNIAHVDRSMVNISKCYTVSQETEAIDFYNRTMIKTCLKIHHELL